MFDQRMLKIITFCSQSLSLLTLFPLFSCLVTSCVRYMGALNQLGRPVRPGWMPFDMSVVIDTIVVCFDTSVVIDTCVIFDTSFVIESKCAIVSR